MQCPKCRLINPDNALRCDCGYEFTGHPRERMEPHVSPWSRLAGAAALFVPWLLVAVVGAFWARGEHYPESSLGLPFLAGFALVVVVLSLIGFGSFLAAVERSSRTAAPRADHPERRQWQTTGRPNVPRIATELEAAPTPEGTGTELARGSQPDGSGTEPIAAGTPRAQHDASEHPAQMPGGVGRERTHDGQ